jgi:hypothetical protein
MCAANGVDDVHLIIANSLHRKMTAWEMERMVGSKIFNEFYPDRYYNHDAEDDENLIKIGETRHDEPLRVNRRAIESDILIYLNLNLVPMDGGHKSVRSGCAIMNLCASITSRRRFVIRILIWIRRVALNHKVIKLGKLVDEHCNVFHIETAINNKMFPEGYDILTRNEDEFSFADRMKWEVMGADVFKNAARRASEMLHAIPAQYELIGCLRAKRKKFTRNSRTQLQAI